MTRNSAAVAALDDRRRRRRRCPISVASSNVVDDASSPMTNSIATSGSSSNGDVGAGGDGASSSSPKSSSAVSTTTSCCGGSSSSSSRSGSDDDDSSAIARSSAVINDGCLTSVKSPVLLSLHKEVAHDNRGDKDSSSSNNSNDAVASTSIGGRLTFYKDGKFIFQLAAHYQQHPSNSRSAIMSPCRWIPVPTAIQQQKNNVKSMGEWPQHQQNKTIWPYLVTNPGSDSKSPQPIHQSQPSNVRVGECMQQQYQHITPPPLTLVGGTTVNVDTLTANSVVVATTANLARRPSRKCSTTMAVGNTTDRQHQHNQQPQSQLRSLSRRSHQHQHQSFIMVVTETMKVQRHLFPKKHRNRCKKKRSAMLRSILQDQQKVPTINLEGVVRYLWCRRHTTELLLRSHSSSKKSGDITSTIIDATPSVSRHGIDSTCTNLGSSKRQSVFFPSPTTTCTDIPITAITTSGNNTNITGSISTGGGSPHKKCKLGQQEKLILQHQRRLVVDNSVKKSVPPPPTPSGASTNDHSITAILSGGAAGAKRISVNAAVQDTEDYVIITSTTTTTTTTNSASAVMSSKNPAPLSLLRTLLKSPSGETSGPPSIIASANGGGYRHHISGSRKRSAVKSTSVPPLTVPSSVVGTAVDMNGLRTSATMAMLPPIATDASVSVNDALTAIHHLPSVHHPTAAGQLAAAGYFNVLYHQAAMAAAMVYQNHARLPQPLPKPPQPPPPLMSSQFATAGGTGSSWQCQLSRRPLLPPPESVGGNGITTISTSASTIVAPYSSPLVAATMNGIGLLPPATPSPPPPLLLHPHPVHHHHLLLHHQQQHQQQQCYQPAPTVHTQPTSLYQYKPRQHCNSIKKRTLTTMDAAEYCGGMDGSNEVAAEDESSSSTDCVPLNLSKDSVADNVGSANTTTTVR